MMKDLRTYLLRPFSRADAGLGLVGVLVAVAILGLGVVGTLQSMLLINKRKSAVEWVGERSGLKSLLLNGTSCSTLERCRADEEVEIRSADGRILVMKDRSSRYGPFLVSARCQADRTVEFRVAAFKEGVFGKDPLTGKVLDWQSPEGVLIEGGDLCGTPQFGTSQEKSEAPEIYSSPLCTADRGTCALPRELAGEPIMVDRMCCVDGRDSLKPTCPADKYELGAYWDRDGDWGLNGRWVVTCQ